MIGRPLPARAPQGQTNRSMRNCWRSPGMGSRPRSMSEPTTFAKCSNFQVCDRRKLSLPDKEVGRPRWRHMCSESRGSEADNLIISFFHWFAEIDFIGRLVKQHCCSVGPSSPVILFARQTPVIDVLCSARLSAGHYFI
jgi:hypothetical protein